MAVNPHFSWIKLVLKVDSTMKMAVVKECAVSDLFMVKSRKNIFTFFDISLSELVEDDVYFKLLGELSNFNYQWK